MEDDEQCVQKLNQLVEIQIINRDSSDSKKQEWETLIPHLTRLLYFRNKLVSQSVWIVGSPKVENVSEGFHNGFGF